MSSLRKFYITGFMFLRNKWAILALGIAAASFATLPAW